MIRSRVFKMAGGQTLMDNSPGAWMVEIGRVWLARFGSEWRERYPTTWAFGLGDQTWWYTPEEEGPR